MIKIARQKGGATAFAKAVDVETGAVTRWCEREEECCEVTDPVAEKVAAHYSKRPDAGTIKFSNGRRIEALDVDDGPRLLTGHMAELAELLGCDKYADPDDVAEAAVDRLLNLTSDPKPDASPKV